jgi:hypothetical protein
MMRLELDELEYYHALNFSFRLSVSVTIGREFHGWRGGEFCLSLRFGWAERRDETI